MNTKVKKARESLLKAYDALTDAVEIGGYPIDFELRLNKLFQDVWTYDESQREPARQTQLIVEQTLKQSPNVDSKPTQEQPDPTPKKDCPLAAYEVITVTSQYQPVDIVALLNTEEAVDKTQSNYYERPQAAKKEAGVEQSHPHRVSKDIGAIEEVEAVKTELVDLDYDPQDTDAEIVAVSSQMARKIEEPPAEEQVETYAEVHETLSTKPPQVQQLEGEEITKLTKRIESLKNKLAGTYNKSDLVNSLRGIRQVFQQANPGVNLDKLAAVSIIDIEGYAENTIKFMQAELNKLKSGSDPK
jgi:hypothetical protein